jgi:hypothetical protein
MHSHNDRQLKCNDQSFTDSHCLSKHRLNLPRFLCHANGERREQLFLVAGDRPERNDGSDCQRIACRNHDIYGNWNGQRVSEHRAGHGDGDERAGLCDFRTYGCLPWLIG